ncbi:S-methyl-5-thioribose kinase [Bacillus sp. 31A1R]|uniref:Methylthioribose kinase n=1 Tax=Robertmurraya mangrovi TaxID=3098077 RepID=A0ABU5ITR1_9BACI|nr:S-methyl-5-thioribose kinase [Bacillus sp. 31A1R]MDZ5470532.1 S-methyl-5-thioribose kinase [Bacillus sp. 31A1R]
MTLLQQKKYEPLTESSAIALAVRLRIFPTTSVLTCKEIGDGNLNLVFRVIDNQTSKSIIIKQALPYAKVVGESWPLTLKRATIEAEALKFFKTLAPDYVPTVFYSDQEFAITVMEDLSHLTIARTGLIQGQRYPLLAEHLGEYLANTLFYTSDFGLDQQKKKELVAKFINPELCKITEDLVFTDPFFNSPTNEFETELENDVKGLWSDQQLRLQTALLKKSFLTEAEVLLHGDLHTGSVFASETETKVIDPEFAYFGPAGFDLGQVIANLLFQAIAFEEKRDIILNDIETFWRVFVEHFSTLWNTQNVEPYSITEGYLSIIIDKYLKDAIGFAGCELIRRTIGLAHVADLDGIEDLNNRIHAKRSALKIGRHFILSRNDYKSITDLLRNLEF